MGPHSCQTDQAKRVTLPSAIDSVAWTRARASGNGLVGLEVSTHFVGNGADLKIELSDKSGKSHGSFAEKISGNRFWAEVRVPPNAKDELYATAKLPKHGLSLKSAPLTILPTVQITNLKWSQKEARRGDTVALSADVKGAPDGTEATIDIYEHDTDGAHDPVTSIPVLVKNKKVEAQWEFEFHEDTQRIPNEQEVQKYGSHYVSPKYFFSVTATGSEAVSGLLEFKDSIEIELLDHQRQPIPNARFEITFSDGKVYQGNTDANGQAIVPDVPPGSYRLVSPLAKVPITVSTQKELS
jgi:hypothetical protein